MKNKMSDLRDHLFLVLEGLTDPDPDKPMELERAKAVAEVAQVVINSAKVEVDFLKIRDKAAPSGFFIAERPALPGAPATSRVLEHAEGEP